MVSFNAAFDPEDQDFQARIQLCTQMRGVRENSPLTRTTFWRGEYESNAALRAEFFNVSGVHQ